MMKKIVPLTLGIALLLGSVACQQPQQLVNAATVTADAGSLVFLTSGFGFSSAAAESSRALDPSNSDPSYGGWVQDSELSLTDASGTVSVVSLGSASGSPQAWKPTAIIPAGTYTAVFSGYNSGHVKISQSDPQELVVGATAASVSFYCRPYDPMPTPLVVGTTLSGVQLKAHMGDYRSWVSLPMADLKADTIYHVVVSRVPDPYYYSYPGFVVSSDAGSQVFQNLSWFQDSVTFSFASQFKTNRTVDLIVTDYSAGGSFTVLVTETPRKFTPVTAVQRYVEATKGTTPSDDPTRVTASLSVTGLTALVGTSVRLVPGTNRWAGTLFGSFTFPSQGSEVQVVSPEGTLNYTFLYSPMAPAYSTWMSGGTSYWGDADAGLRFETADYPMAVIKTGAVTDEMQDVFFVRTSKAGVKAGDSISLSLNAGSTALNSLTGFRYFSTWSRAATVATLADGSGQLTVIVPPEAKAKLGRMVPDFAVEAGAVVTIGGVVQQPRASVVDFTQPVVYKVTSEDKSQVKSYSVVLKDDVPSTLKTMLFYGLQPNTSFTVQNERSMTVATFATDSMGSARVPANLTYWASQTVLTLYRGSSWSGLEKFGEMVVEGIDSAVSRSLEVVYLPFYHSADPKLSLLRGFTDLLALPEAIPLEFGTPSEEQTLSESDAWYQFTPAQAFAKVSLKTSTGTGLPVAVLLYDNQGHLVEPASSLYSLPLGLTPGLPYRVRVVNAYPPFAGSKLYQLVAAPGTLDQAITFATGDSATSTKKNLSLASMIGATWNLVWVSDQPGTISNSGQVVRPAEGQPDVVVTLTATVSNGTTSEALSSQVTVKAVPLGGEGGFNLNLVTPTLLSVSLSSYSSAEGSYGSSRTFYTNVSLPVDSYSWYLDGQPLSSTLNGSASQQSVTLPATLPPGRHSIFVLVRQGSTLATATSDFTVLAPTTALTFRDPVLVGLSIYSMPTTLVEGTTLSATSYSYEFDQYQWYLDGFPVQGQTTRYLSSGARMAPGRHTLSLAASKGGHWYATSGYFTVTPSGTTVSVVDPLQASLSLSGKSATVVFGSDVRVWAYSSLSIDTYQWYYDGILVQTGSDSSFNVSGFLPLGGHSLMVLAKKGTISLTDTWYFTVQK